MSYLAIARKYRPATFDEIVGQDHVTRTLRNAIAKNRIHHAFLFTGARGVGKTTAARALARSLNCANGPTDQPCGSCTSCVEVTSGSSMDLIEIDGASNNSVEDVREIREAVRYAPTGSGWKIYLIDEVHMLSKGAFNALLKTLEEPPAHVLFIFATTEPNRIPDTILSRVQRFDFKRIPVPSIVERLKEIAVAEAVTINESGLRLIARSGEGSMRDAQSLFDQVISYAGTEITDEHVVECLGLIDRGLLYSMLSALLQGQPSDCLDCIQKAYANGYDLSRFSEEMLDILRNATFVRLSKGARKHVDLPDDELEQLLQITQDVDPNQLSRLFSALVDVHDRVSRASRPKIILEMAVAQLADIRPVRPLAELVERLESLERRLSGGEPPPARPPGSRPSRKLPATQSSSTVSRPTPTSQAVVRQAPKAQHAAPAAAVHLKLVESPPEESPESEPKVAPVVAPQASPDDRWAAFQAQLKGTDKELDALLTGSASFDEDKLTIRCRAGLEAAMAKRAVQQPKVATALGKTYGPTAEVEVLALRTRDLHGEQEWVEKAMEKPGIALLMSELDAEIENIVPHTDGDAT